MLKVEIIDVSGIFGAMIGMRYPKNSEKEGDSLSFSDIGIKDRELLLRLTKAGRDHRKTLRMIHVQASVLMPISWWIQYDTYKVATVANSRSRMHKMGSRLLTEEDFYVEHWTKAMSYVLEELNKDIIIWQQVKDKAAWRRVIDLLPMSYMQERMIDLNYETLLSILESRYNEKLRGEWRFFCDSFLASCVFLRELWESLK